MRQLEIFDMDLKLMLFGKLSPYLFIKENILFAKLLDSIRVKQTILKIIVYMFRSQTEFGKHWNFYMVASLDLTYIKHPDGLG